MAGSGKKTLVVTSLGLVEPGRMLGDRYRVGPPLGSGGMAEVFLGGDRLLDRDVAIKVLRAETAGDAGLRRRFETEGRAAARLSHPNVVGVYDVGEEGAQPYLVMELVTGGTLAELIRQGPLSEDAVKRVCLDILAGLGAAHAVGILHRDVKPGNVLISEGGTAKLADFGIAKASSPPATDGLEATATDLVIGTPSYLSPERAAGEPASVGSDLWAVGVLAYEALAGAKPFQGPTPLAVVLAARNGEAVPLGERRPDVSPRLVAVVEQSLNADPTARFDNAAAMAAAISGTGSADPLVGNPPLAPTEVLHRPPVERGRRRRGAVLAIASLVAVSALVLGLALAQVGSPGSAHQPPGTVPSQLPTTVPVSTTAPGPTTSVSPAPVPGAVSGTTVAVPSTTTTAGAPTDPGAQPPAGKAGKPAHGTGKGSSRSNGNGNGPGDQ